AFVLRFLVRRLAIATRFRLFNLSPLPNTWKEPAEPAPGKSQRWLRGSDSNRRPSGYEFARLLPVSSLVVPDCTLPNTHCQVTVTCSLFLSPPFPGHL